jgi:hypothetical protein
MIPIANAQDQDHRGFRIGPDRNAAALGGCGRTAPGTEGRYSL